MLTKLLKRVAHARSAQCLTSTGSVKLRRNFAAQDVPELKDSQTWAREKFKENNEYEIDFKQHNIFERHDCPEEVVGEPIYKLLQEAPV